MIHEVTKALWLFTPKGKALCHFIIDYGIESDIYYVCAQHDTGEMWTWSNRDVRIDQNITLGRGIPKPFYEPEDVAIAPKKLIRDTDDIALSEIRTLCSECRAYNCGCDKATCANCSQVLDECACKHGRL